MTTSPASTLHMILSAECNIAVSFRGHTKNNKTVIINMLSICTLVNTLSSKAHTLENWNYEKFMNSVAYYLETSLSGYVICRTLNNDKPDPHFTQISSNLKIR